MARRNPHPEWCVSHGVQVFSNGQGRLFIEGALFRADEDRGESLGEWLLERIQQRGAKAFADISGDFVACYVTRDDVFAFKSFTSQYQLYFCEASASVSNRLFHFVEGSSPDWDEGYFARHTLIVPGMQFHGWRTPLAGVERVLPGELVCLGPKPSRLKLVHRNYRYQLDPQQSREDVAPEVLRLLRQSVRDQLNAYPDADICIEISGGLDSSFIACLVGEIAHKAKGVMFSQPNIPSHRISEGYAKEVADRYGINLTILSPQDLPAVPVTDPAYSDEPSDFFWFGELFSEAVARLATPGSLVFTGFGADQLFLRSPAFVPYLLEQREYRQFLGALGPVGKLLSRSPLSLALQSMASQIPRERYYRLAQMFAGKAWNPLDVSDVNLHRMLYSPVAWLTVSGSQQGLEEERLAAEKSLVGNGIICDDWGYFAAPRAVTFPHFSTKQLVDASPFCDLRLIDFMYDKVSALLVHDFQGRYKELLREAQKGIVPESLRSRTNDTFVFNSFQLGYVNQARDFFHSLLEDCPAGWVDKKLVQVALEELAFGLMTSSTRSLVALMGYLTWQLSFQRHLRAHRQSVPPLVWHRWAN